MLGVLFNVEAHTINYHIKKIFNDSELSEISTTRKFRIVQNEGERTINREIIHYNLQMIIAIGFKVNCERAVQFRKWANSSQHFVKMLSNTPRITCAFSLSCLEFIAKTSSNSPFVKNCRFLVRKAKMG